MQTPQDIVSLIALSMGAAWASGINLYATIFMLGIMGSSGGILLPEGLQILTNPAVIAAAGLMFMVEFCADKVPGLDSAWDAVHTFIRIPAGIMLAANAVGPVDPAAQMAAAIIGGVLTTGSHAAKSGTRLIANTSPEPFTNWALSIGEDIAVFVGIWAALQHPYLFLAALVLFVGLMIWFLPILFRGLARIFGWFRKMFSSRKNELSEGQSAE
mgnify:CR=1 FL=1